MQSAEPTAGDSPSAADLVRRLRQGQRAWGLLPLEARCERLLAFRDRWVDAADDLVSSVVETVGKPRLEALSHEVLVVADVATHYARRSRRVLAPREIEHRLLRHRRSYVHFAPRGIVAVIGPFNAPLAVPMVDAITALVAGNGVVVKPSELATAPMLMARDLMRDAGIPGDVFDVLPGGADAGMALVEARPDYVVFTGSADHGRQVAAACGERLIPCTLELGGNGAAVICRDADVERAARAVAYGAFANAGQSCLAVRRAFVHVGVFDDFRDRLVALASELRLGEPSSDVVDVGPVARPAEAERAVRLVSEAVAHGARLEAGGRLRDDGILEPTVVSGCSPDMGLLREELLAPVVAVARIGDEAEAVDLVNATPDGLVAYVFGKDRERARGIAEALRVGTVMVNDVFSAYGMAEAPFGGVRDSGWGKVHGDEGLRAMCEARQVSYDRIPIGARDPLWFPYGDGAYRAVSKAMRVLYRSGSPVKKLLDLF